MKKDYIYCVQVVPDLKPTRLKIGKSYKPENRLAKFRTVSPTARCLGVWESRASGDEEEAILLLTKAGMRIGKEVVDVDDLESSLAKLHEHFERS